MRGMGDGKGGGGLKYLNAQSLTHFLLHEAPRSIEFLLPCEWSKSVQRVPSEINVLHLHNSLRWKNDKHEK